MKRLLLGFTLFLCNGLVDAKDVASFLRQTTQVVETKNITDVLKFVTPKTLVVFDIDNTLAAPATVLGSDQWFSQMVQHRLNEGFDSIHAINSVLPIYFLVQFNVDLELVDPKALEVLSELKNADISSVCLTARSLHLAERTLEQVGRINIKMSPPTIDEMVLTLAHTSFFKGGTLFSGLNDKGEVLFSYLDRIGLRPDNIVFVDDKYSNIKTVELATLNRQIPFVGVHYTALEEEVKNYNHARAEKELEKFLISRG
jgi:hypothetical protein